MFRLSKTLIIFLSLIFTSSLLAQDSYKYNYNYDWEDWYDYNWEFDYDRPFIEFNYGFGEPKHEDFNADFAKIGLLELKLGYLKESELIHYNIDDREEGFVFGSVLSPELSSVDPTLQEFESKLWRFGFATRNTLGYYGDYFSILPYHQEGFAWSQLVNNPLEDPIIYTTGNGGFIGDPLTLEKMESDYKIIERYHDAFRFGTVAEGGIRLEFVNSISVNAGYEASVIFPRHLFWKHAGSYIIQKAGQGALTYFIDEITDSSPIAGPIVNFILQNGYSYAFYSLMKKDMNWPFSTETPLTYETFKFGLTFTF